MTEHDVEKSAAWNIGTYRPYTKAKHGLCSHCGINPPANKRGGYCKECRASYMRAWRAKNA